MKRYLLASLGIAAILFPLFWYVYSKGMEDGVTRYKRSKNFELTLQSMFLYGLGDGIVRCCNNEFTCGEEKKHVAHKHH